MNCKTKQDFWKKTTFISEICCRQISAAQYNRCQSYKTQNTVKLQKKWLCCNEIACFLVIEKILIYKLAYHCELQKIICIYRIGSSCEWQFIFETIIKIVLAIKLKPTWTSNCPYLFKSHSYMFWGIQICHFHPSAEINMGSKINPDPILQK